MERYERELDEADVNIKEVLGVRCPECGHTYDILVCDGYGDVPAFTCCQCQTVFSVRTATKIMVTRYAPVDPDAVADARHWVNPVARLPESDWEGMVRATNPNPRAAKYWVDTDGSAHWVLFIQYRSEAFEVGQEYISEWLDLTPPVEEA